MAHGKMDGRARHGRDSRIGLAILHQSPLDQAKDDCLGPWASVGAGLFRSALRRGQFGVRLSRCRREQIAEFLLRGFRVRVRRPWSAEGTLTAWLFVFLPG